jgi:DNA replication protein DnaC
LWKPYIPFAKLTLFEGDPGTGKSWVSLAIATAVSGGEGLPNNQLGLASGEVLIASAEDGLADTIRPRLDSLGADLSRIRAIDGLFTLDDLGFSTLEGVYKRVYASVSHY